MTAKKMTYAEQLRHPNWQRKRLEVLDRAAFKCERCKSAETTLHVHHKQYFKGRMAWEYEADELQALCEPCHQEEHFDIELLKRMLVGARVGDMSPSYWAAGFVAGFAAAVDQVDADAAEEALATCDSAFAMGFLMGVIGLPPMIEIVKPRLAQLSAEKQYFARRIFALHTNKGN